MMKLLNNRSQQSRSSLYPRDNYQLIEISDGLQSIYSEIIFLKDEIAQLRKENAENKLQKLTETKKDFFTIKDVSDLFDISPRTQQDERTNFRLDYLKKVDGIKILYTKEHIQEYISKYYLSPNLKK